MNQETLVDKFGRVLIPIVTPFDDNGEVGISNLKGLCEHIRKNDLSDSIIVGGTTGEFASLTTEERLKIFEVVRESVTDQPVIAGTGAASTRETIRLTRAAEEMGMDMAMVVCPYYLKPTPRGILEHFREVAKSTKLPILLYNIPLFTGVNLDPEVVRELAKIENVVAIKEEAELNPTQITRFILEAGDSITVYCGDDTMVLPAMSQGAVGVVSGGSQIVGKDMKRMIELFLSGKLKEAQEIHYKTYKLFRAFGMNGRINPIPMLKEALNLAGVRVGKPRPPLRCADDEERDEMRRVMEGLNLL